MMDSGKVVAYVDVVSPVLTQAIIVDGLNFFLSVNLVISQLLFCTVGRGRSLRHTFSPLSFFHVG